MDYAIGDVQGCFNSLNALLKKINFNIDRDRLYFLGDVVNRGSHSLETLRFLYSNKDNADMVLGNHDFHLLVCALSDRHPNKKDTFHDILEANDKNTLLDYLIEKPLAIEYEDCLMVHAGVPPNWSQSDVINNAALVHSQLRNENLSEFLSQMYGNLPHTWSENLTIEEKCRYTINALMRIRFCKEDGELEFEHKLNIDKNPTGYKAWFLHKNHLMKEQKIFFGHWSSLKNINTNNIYPLDHGCIWGGQLTAYNLTNNTYISQDSVEI